MIVKEVSLRLRVLHFDINQPLHSCKYSYLSLVLKLTCKQSIVLIHNLLRHINQW